MQAVRQEVRLRARLAAACPKHTYKIDTTNRFVRQRREAAMASIEGECRRWLCRRARRKIAEAFVADAAAFGEGAEPGAAAGSGGGGGRLGSVVELAQLQAALKEAKASSDGFAMLQQELIEAKLSIAELNFQNEQQRYQAKLERRQTYG